MLGGLEKNMTLYKKVALLTMIAVFVSLFTEYLLIYTITDNFNLQKKENSALLTANTLAESALLKKAVSNYEGDQGEISTLIDTLSNATLSNIVVFDMDKKVLFVEIQVEEPDFIGQSRELAFSDIDKVASRDQLQNKDYYSNTVKQKLFDITGNQIGVVVVAELSSDLELQQSYENLFLIFLANLVGLIVGVVGSMFLVKSIKDTLFGLEPEAIAKLLEERIAMIDSVQEGVLCINEKGEITLLNANAQRIFEYAGLKISDTIGLNIDSIYSSDMKEVLFDGVAHINYEEKINNVTVITNQLPIKMHNKIVGAITTFRLKTEMEELAQQLTGVQTYADALRAQTHEFMNKIHVILGLTELEQYEELKGFIKNVANHRKDETRYISERLKDPVLSGFVLGKMSRARELDIDFYLTEESYIPELMAQAYIDKIISIIGNLINNAFEALAHYEGERIVLLSMLVFDDDLVITVEDSAEGIDNDEINKIFIKGFSSKGKNRGIGLNIVQQALEDIGGKIYVESIQGEGTIFTVYMPYVER